MKIIGIYGLRNTKTNKWYVGYSKDIYKRWNQNYRRLQCKKQPKLFAALLKYGYDAFDKVVLEECCADASIWGPKESYWITKYNSIKSGYNVVAGGQGGDKSSGCHRSDEFKENLRRLKTGVKRSPETVQKIKDARARQILKPLTKEQRLARSVQSSEYWKTHSHPFLGTNRPKSEETKAKISATKKLRGDWVGVNNPNYQHGRKIKPSLVHQNTQPLD